MSLPSFDVTDPAAKSFYDERGWVLVDTLEADGVAELRAWVDEIAAWPDAAGEWLHYREMTDHGPELCRTEHFVTMHVAMRSLLTAGPMLAAATSLLGEPAVLYKEKVNYKLAGGAGYSPHQDAPAYPFVDAHLSCMVAVDDADETNGCLEVVSGMQTEILATDAVGCISAEVAARLVWEPAPVQSGQTLWFHSRTPHRSAANRSDTDRRALYPTYNALAEGDLRVAYYREKLDRMRHQQIGNGVQVSLIGDFQGRRVE